MQTSCIGFSRIKDRKLAQTFNSGFRCHSTILDSVSICISYSNKPEVKDTTNSQKSASYLEIDNGEGKLKTKLGQT
jgi:hypothetical protein